MFTSKMFISRNAAVLFVLTSCLLPVLSYANDDDRERDGDRGHNVQVGPRPFYLVDKMSPSPLKRKLEQCSEGPFYKTDFSIGHRGGGTLQFPEHTKESHEAGARMGAGIQECDVTFTKDGQLVCRHDQCDLHTTTNILVTPLAAMCSQPFSPAEFDASGNRMKAATALCCTSDLNVSEYKSLKGKMDASNPNATTPAGIPGRYCELAHRPLFHRCYPADPQGEHRAARQAGKQVHPGAEGSEPQRQLAGGIGVWQPGGLRPGDDRRLQRRPVFLPEKCGRSLSIKTTSCTGSRTSRHSAGRPCIWTTPMSRPTCPVQRS